MLQAVRNTVIVKPIYEEVSRGGIIVPKSAKRHRLYHGSIRGEVISVGPKSIFRHELKPGDKIIFRRHEGKKVYEHYEMFLSMRDRWIMGKVVGE